MKQLLFIFLSIIVFLSCKKEANLKVNKQIDLENPFENETLDLENTLNWDGSYVGILPCSDCEGRNTEIILRLNHSFIKSTLFIKSDKPELEEKGSFIWLDDGCTIILDDKDKTKLKVGFNTLTVLNRQGNKIKENTDNYTLEKNVCEEKDFEEFKYKGNDGKEYLVVFGHSCDGLFSEIKSDNVSVQLLRETASELRTIYGNNKDIKLIEQDDKAILRIKYKEIILTPEN